MNHFVRILILLAILGLVILADGCGKPKPSTTTYPSFNPKNESGSFVIASSLTANGDSPVVPRWPKLIVDHPSTLQVITTGEAAWIHWECKKGFHLDKPDYGIAHHPAPTLEADLPKCEADKP